jgi:DNA-3-methyladenine glycosylase
LFARPAEVVAPDLLGHVLSRTLDTGEVLSGRIVEIEAYIGPEDRASHAWKGRRTPRNEAMYAPPGTCYVYLTYGMHFMCNVACLREGHPAAVLIRALEPLTGLDTMRLHRPVDRDEDLCSGPGKLCQALAITRDLNGVDLVTDPRLRLLQARNWSRADLNLPGAIVRSARVGVDSCGEWAETPLRWYIRGDRNVSPGRPSRNAAGDPTRTLTAEPGGPAPGSTPNARGANRGGISSE